MSRQRVTFTIPAEAADLLVDALQDQARILEERSREAIHPDIARINHLRAAQLKTIIAAIAAARRGTTPSRPPRRRAR